MDNDASHIKSDYISFPNSTGQIQIGPVFFQSSFSILEDQPMDMLLGLDMLKRHQVSVGRGGGVCWVWLAHSRNDNNINNIDNNDCISRAPFHVKHAQLRWTGANTKCVLVMGTSYLT